MTMRTYSGKNIRRSGLLGLLGVAMLVLLAACGGTTDATVAPATATTDAAMPAMTTEAMATAPANTDTAATPDTGAGTSSGSGTAVTATLREWAIDLSQAEVPAGKVTFTVTNQGQMPHNLTVTQNGATVGATSTFGSAAGAQTLAVDLKPGTYTLICSLPGHAQRGQKIDLVVK